VPDWVYAVVLGIVEGLTEFIPVSSTGMMLLTKKAMGLEDPFWNTFAVMIQLGAILAVVVLYFRKLWNQVVGLRSDPAARRFALSVLLAFLPSAVLGLFLIGFIKGVLFDSPRCSASRWSWAASCCW
jgi:undecaprenyl-diphosphatase